MKTVNLVTERLITEISLITLYETYLSLCANQVSNYAAAQSAVSVATANSFLPRHLSCFADPINSYESASKLQTKQDK